MSTSRNDRDTGRKDDWGVGKPPHYTKPDNPSEDSDRAGPWHISTVLPAVIGKLKQRCGDETVGD